MVFANLFLGRGVVVVFVDLSAAPILADHLCSVWDVLVFFLDCYFFLKELGWVFVQKFVGFWN